MIATNRGTTNCRKRINKPAIMATMIRATTVFVLLLHLGDEEVTLLKDGSGLPVTLIHHRSMEGKHPELISS